jgi:hypothetical protein
VQFRFVLSAPIRLAEAFPRQPGDPFRHNLGVVKPARRNEVLLDQSCGLPSIRPRRTSRRQRGQLASDADYYPYGNERDYKNSCTNTRCMTDGTFSLFGQNGIDPLRNIMFRDMF